MKAWAVVILLLAAPTADELWPKLPPAKPGDWRWRHDEKPQTLKQYRAASPKRPTERRRYVYVLPAWTRPGAEEARSKQTDQLLAAFFGRPVKRLAPRPLPSKAYDPELRRYSIRKLVPFLTRTLPDDAIFLLAVTDRDLRLPGSRYTYGWGSMKHRVGICSTWRIGKNRRHRYWGLVLHEATHMLSVPHCTERSCLMNGALDFKEADTRPLLLCWECRDKVCWNLGTDPLARYLALADAWTKAGLPAVTRKIELARGTLSTKPSRATPPRSGRD
ncbi:MAG: archaemetzincin [Planctomycetota bacterium]